MGLGLGLDGRADGLYPWPGVCSLTGAEEVHNMSQGTWLWATQQSAGGCLRLSAILNLSGLSPLRGAESPCAATTVSKTTSCVS